MQNGNFDSLSLRIEKTSKGTRWIFRTIEGRCARIRLAFEKFSYAVKKRFHRKVPVVTCLKGREVEQFYTEGRSFHAKLHRVLENAKLLGKGLVSLEQKGIKGKILDESYWLELATPDHITGPYRNYLDMFWQDENRLSFHEWLDTPAGEKASQEYQALQDEHPEGVISVDHQKVYYLNRAQRQQHKLDFIRSDSDPQVRMQLQGIDFNTNGYSTESGVGKAIFVIDSNEQMYVGSHTIYQFHHSSFLRGGAVLGAGEVMTDPQGHLKAITNKSGHYKPGKEEMLNTLEFLEKKQIDLSSIELHMVVSDGIWDVYNAKEFLNTKGNIPALFQINTQHLPS